jgi:predicted ATPase
VHYERALALLERQPAGHERTERELMLRIGLGSVMVVAKGWGSPEVEDAYVRARDLCGELGDEPRLFPALWGLWLFYWGRGPLSTALELSERLLASATTADDRALRLQAHHAFWATAFSRGELPAALCHAASGLSVYEADCDAALAATYGGHDAGACGHSFSARALVLMGRTNEAVQRSHEATAQAEALAQPFSLAIAEVAAAAVDHMRRDPASTRAHAMTAARIAGEQEFPLVLAWAAVYLGWVEVEEGRRDEGLRKIRDGVTNALATGSTQFVTSYLGMLAEAHLRCGEPEAGLQAIDEALGTADRTGERFYEAELYRLRGELLLTVGSATGEHEADGAFERALDVSRGQGATLLAVRAAISRGRLWCRLGRRDQARQLVRATCDDLAESLIDADALDVRALLRD